MKVQKAKQESGAVLLILKGEFDSAMVDDFNAMVDGLLADGDTRIVVNMRLIKFLNSSAIGSIIRTKKACEEAGGALAISQPSPAVTQPLEITKLDQVFSIHESDEAALSAVG